MPHRRAIFALSLPLALLFATAERSEAQASGRTAAALPLTVDSASRVARIDSLFSAYTVAPSPGLAVAVVRDGQLVFSKGYGLANIEHGIPITGTTVFDVASVSKQFAGLAVAMLSEQKKIDLAADITAYIPEMSNVGQRITIDHLVHHTSGLRDWPGTLALAGWRMDDVISFDQILRMAYAQRSLNFVPGAEYTYSNTGYNLLAETVARVTGKSFPAWTEERIFRPLGMTRTLFRDDHTSIVPDRAQGYERRPDGTFRAAPDNLTALGSSSMYSSAEDLAKWVVNFETAEVGGRSAMELTRTRGTLNSGARIPYAFGVSHGEYRGRPTVNHSGSWAQFATYVVHFPEQRLGVVVLANSGSVNPTRAALDVADAFLGESRVVAAASDTSLRARPVVPVPAALLHEYAGVYRLGPGWYLNIRKGGQSLLTQATSEAEFPLSARSEREFWVEAYGAAIAFERDAAGKVTGISYRNIRAPRITGPASAPSASVLAALAGEYESAELGTSYTISVKDSSLVLTHFRHGSAPLAWVMQEFISPWWFARTVRFEQGANGAATMVVDMGERSRNVRFARR